MVSLHSYRKILEIILNIFIQTQQLEENLKGGKKFACATE
jgi:hypothetical protein